MKVLGFDSEKYSFVIRGGFGISHFPINGNNRSASPDFGWIHYRQHPEDRGYDQPPLVDRGGQLVVPAVQAERK